MPTVRTKKHPDSAGETEGAPFLVPYKRICQLEAAEVDASRVRTALEAIVSTVCHYSNTTIERVAMAMEWQKLPSVERDYARNRARAPLDAIAEVTPSGGVSR